MISKFFDSTSMDRLKSGYRDVKLNWGAIISSTGQGPLKNAMNAVILGQRTRTQHPDEWGELADYAGLQEKIVTENARRILDAAKELEIALEGMQALVDRLKENVEKFIESDAPESSEPQLSQLVSTYSRELQLRRRILADLLAMKYANAAYDVIVTVTAMWTGRCYTNERAIGHIAANNARCHCAFTKRSPTNRAHRSRDLE